MTTYTRTLPNRPTVDRPLWHTDSRHRRVAVRAALLVALLTVTTFVGLSERASASGMPGGVGGRYPVDVDIDRIVDVDDGRLWQGDISDGTESSETASRADPAPGGMTRDTVDVTDPQAVLPDPPGDVPPPDPDSEDEPGRYSGGFGGETVITAARQRGLPETPPLDSFNVIYGLAVAWNSAMSDVEQLAELLVAQESGGKLYDVDVRLEPAGAASWLNLTVVPSDKHVSLFYFVPGHRVTAKADVDFVDHPDVTVDFDLALIVDITTEDAPGQPLRLVSAEARVMHVNVSTSGDWSYKIGRFVSDVTRWVKTWGQARGIEQIVASRLTGHSEDLGSSLGAPIASANDAIREVIDERGSAVGGITPYYDADRHHLVLRLDPPAPSARRVAFLVR